MTEPETEPLADQYECTRLLVEEYPDAAIVSNLGTATYALANVEDRAKNFYMNGGMGVTTSVGLGLALVTDDPVVVLDGDGSALMSLGALATVGRCDPANLAIVVWNNEQFETTGGQPTLAPQVDFPAVAENCGLAGSRVSSTDEFLPAIREAVETPGASLVDCHVHPYSPPEKPDLDYAHSYMKHRFRRAVTD